MSKKSQSKNDPWKGRFDPAKLPPMNMQTFYVQHPDLPEIDHDRFDEEISALTEAMGLQFSIYPVDIPGEDRGDVVGWLRNWRPQPPAGARVICYGDSEDGPYFIAATPIAKAAQAPEPPKHKPATTTPPAKTISSSRVALFFAGMAVLAVTSTIALMDDPFGTGEEQGTEQVDAVVDTTSGKEQAATNASAPAHDDLPAEQAESVPVGPAPEQQAQPSAPEVVPAPVAVFASTGTALELANQIVAGKHRPTIELQGNVLMPRREALDVIGRALGLKEAGAPECAITLTEQSTSVDYRMAMAMSRHFTGKVCVPHTIKVEEGRTLMEMYLKGVYAPAKVKVLGLDPGVSLHEPADAKTKSA